MKRRNVLVCLILILALCLTAGTVLAASVEEVHRHCICGADDCTSHGGDQTWTAWTSTTSLPTEAGYYYLTDDVTVSGNTSPADGVYLCLNGHDVRCSAESSNVITVGGTVAFTLTDCCTDKVRYATDPNGDGVYETVVTEKPSSGKYFSFTGGAFIGGTSHTGGVIYSSGIFNMYGGTITGHYSTHIASAVGVMSGTFNMYGGTIGGCRAKDREGAIHNWYGTTNFYGGTLCNNVSVHYSENNRTNVYGGTFTGNTGRILTGWSTVNIYGGTFTKNTSNTWLTNDVAIMTGGTVTDNTLTASGVGALPSITTVGGTAVVDNNYNSADDCEYNVRLVSGAKMTVGTGANAPKEGMNVGVYSLVMPTSSASVPVTSNVGDAYTYFSSDRANCVVAKNAGDYVELKYDFKAAIIVETGVKYESVQEAINAATATQTVKLIKDAYEELTIADGKTANLDLNGCVLFGNSGNNSVITVANNATLNITDSNPTAVHYFRVEDVTVQGTTLQKWNLNSDATSGTAWQDLTARPSTGDIIKVTGGCITGGFNTNESQYGDGGGGINVKGTVNMSGGNVVGNMASYEGGGVMVRSHTSGVNAVFNLSGTAAVLGNAANQGGGIYAGGNNSVTGNGDVTVKGNSYVSFNNAVGEGGGVWFRRVGTFADNATISYNTNTQYDGGGIFAYSWEGTLSMTGNVKVIGNHAAGYGGGIRIDMKPKSDLTGNEHVITGATFSGNSADGGGAITVLGLTKVTCTDCSITNNTANYGAGILTDGSSSNLIMSGCTISGNNTTNYGGGGICMNNGTLELNNTTVTGNSSKSKQGGGIYYGSGTLIPEGTTTVTGNTDNNLYLASGKTVTLSDDKPLSTAGAIGVTTATAPTAGNPVPVTGTNSKDYSSKFTSDNTAYEVVNEDNIVKLKVPDQAKVVDKDGKVTYYSQLTDAAAKAPEGSTIYMLRDVTLTTSESQKHLLQIGTSLTLDLGGFTLQGSDVVDATNGATVRVTNGTIKSNSGTSCVGVTGASGSLYVDNVTLTGYNAFYAGNAATHTYLGEGVKAENLRSLYSSNGNGVLHITDGVYTTSVLDCTSSSTLKSKIFITGGCFKYSGVASTLPTYVANGYKVVSCTHGRTGYYDVVIDPTKDNGVELKHIDAQGKETVTKFNTLQDAINAASEGDVIQLTKDLTENLTVPAGKNVVIDLNGKTVTAKDSTKPVITNNGTLILTDSVGGGDLTGGKSGVEQNGTLSVGGKLDLTGDGNTNGNIYLPTGKTVDPATVLYAPNGMKIGVTTEEKPEGDNPVKITSESAADTSSYFTSDEDYAVEDLVVGDKHYAVIYGVRKIVLTSSSASKTYDGLPLTKAEVRVTEGNFLSGDSFTYVCTGSMTNVGCATNEFTYTLSVKSKLKYEVTCEFGTLTVEPVPGKNLQPDADDLRAETEKLIEENPGSTISVWMEINRDVPNKDKLTLQYKTSGKQSIFYQANIYAKIDGETTDIGDTNETVIGVTSKFYFAGRKDIHVYRLHNGTDVDELTETPNANGEYVIFDTANDQIIVKAMKYSTFCFVWKGEPPRTGDNTNLWLYVGMAAVSVLGVATIVVSKKKRKG